MAQEELKRLEKQNEDHQQEIQQLVQTLEERRSSLIDIELKYRVIPHPSYPNKPSFYLGFSNSMYGSRK